eukprot:CAMPEP_0114646982 /NCGR_PEP_ID=MMETSP0191-20121206/5505_1 /TAXON_ID=126664 /ORGANISM="Sorites sp." /LENGTH=206 /DNA_ID=CAMNT_0001859975 /DNA_START=128 /DNA_END=748 /DNA_ORIENTATION=+
MPTTPPTGPVLSTELSEASPVGRSRAWEIQVVNSQTSRACDALRHDSMLADLVAFDAEWVPDFKGSNHPISVLQFAFPSSCKVYVVQLARVGNLPAEVQVMLVNPGVTKVGFGVDFKDTEKLATTGISVYQDSIFDVQHCCARLLGFSRPGLRRAAQELLGYALKKDRRCCLSDWSASELSMEQVEYAALDAWVTLRLFYLDGYFW